MSSRQKLKEKPLHYPRLAYCLVMAGRWQAEGNQRWADYYFREAARIRKYGLRPVVNPHPLIDVFIFYPNENGWSETRIQTTVPEKVGVITEGMQELIDGLLGKETRKAA